MRETDLFIGRAGIKQNQQTLILILNNISYLIFFLAEKNAPIRKTGFEKCKAVEKRKTSDERMII